MTKLDLNVNTTKLAMLLLVFDFSHGSRQARGKNTTPLLWLPPARSNLHSTQARGCAKGVGCKHTPSPHSPRLCAPPGAPAHVLGGGTLYPLPPRAGFAPPRLCVQTGDAGRRTKGTPPSLWPSPPMTCTRTGQGAWNHPPPLWPPSPFMRERGPLVCPPTGHGSGSARHAPPLPPTPFAKRTQEWAAT
jgi:hypothetical protein